MALRAMHHRAPLRGGRDLIKQKTQSAYMLRLRLPTTGSRQNRKASELARVLVKLGPQESLGKECQGRLLWGIG